MQCLSKTGWTSRGKLNPRVGPRQGVMSTGLPIDARLRFEGGVVLRFSWQPTHEMISPGIAVYQLRMICRALPSASSGCTAIGVLAGTLNSAEPSL